MCAFIAGLPPLVGKGLPYLRRNVSGLDGETAEQGDELADLRSVVLVSGEHVGCRLDNDKLRPDIECGLLE